MTEPSYVDTTRTAYDDVAVLYADMFRDALDGMPLDRALLAAFADYVKATGDGRPVADLGCGPGRLTGHLRSLGLNVFGVDLSPAMIALARAEHPGLRFEEGSMAELDVADGSLDGIVSWYSIIHMPPEELPAVLAEFHRVLAPGGHLVLAFQAGDDPLRPDPFDHKVALAYRWSLDGVADLTRKAGFTEIARLLREPDESERFRAGHLLTRKPPTS